MLETLLTIAVTLIVVFVFFRVRDYQMLKSYVIVPGKEVLASKLNTGMRPWELRNAIKYFERSNAEPLKYWMLQSRTGTLLVPAKGGHLVIHLPIKEKPSAKETHAAHA